LTTDIYQEGENSLRRREN